VARTVSKPPKKVTEAEYQRFAEHFVDGILDPKQPWLIWYVINDGFAKVPTWEEISSGKFALKMLTLSQREPGLVESWLYDALAKGDRDPLIPWVMEHSRQLTREEMSRLLACVTSTFLRRSLQKLGSTLKGSPGAQTKLPIPQYTHLLETAELLKPAISKMLAFPRTSRTLAETLRYLRKDYPQACEFLTRHIGRFQQALEDPRLLQRARKLIEGRARVLAEAMAGSDYGLSFSTSRERVRRARHLVERPSH
jgi:hypothetical protein